MAVVTQIIQDGPKNAIFKMTIAAANAAAIVVDESALSGATSTIRNFAVTKIQWALTGSIATLSWDAAADVIIADLAAGWGEIDCEEGIPNNSGAGKTGDIQLDNAAGLTTGVILLYVKKS